MSAFIKKLEQLYQQHKIEAIDVERCRFFCRQEPEVSDEVLKAVFITGYRFRQGDVCISLKNIAVQSALEEDIQDKIAIPSLEKWQAKLNESALTGRPGDFTPLILAEGDRLYFQKYWKQENTIAQLLQSRAKQENTVDKRILEEGLDRLFGSDNELNWQKVAAALSVKNKLSVVSGGPGTGKTTTVVRILALLGEQAFAQQTSVDIALAAPTGKAAARLQESITGAKDRLQVSDEVRALIPDEVNTLHQLLGARRTTSKFKYNRDNRLPHKTVVVDEASMIDQFLMSRLLQALRDDARLILLGDKDQLASVEAGSVLGDICANASNQFSRETAQWLQFISVSLPDKNISTQSFLLNDTITLLTKSYRFSSESGIAQLAKATNAGDSQTAIAVLNDAGFNDVTLVDYENYAKLWKILEKDIETYFTPLVETKSAAEAFSIIRKFCIFSPHRRGPYGVQNLNRRIEQRIRKEHLIPAYQKWYSGRPIIITKNDYNLDLYNGDTGICLPNANGELKVFFQKQDEYVAISPSHLADKHDSAYVLTVHKGQGTEFNHVILVLPDKDSKILTRELLYTAVTRAKKELTVLGNKKIVSTSIAQRLARHTGLTYSLKKEED